ncbi:hypothetical protein I7I50_09966 [Histoplasma capsulatum G186AR]|nr:hypothetical protein I7I52_01204 [Histoplasma capsulatum]QSS68857.1 hypothetical protein I7I50_09966 [Histoplasma capsulatum G186AR]
MSCRCSSLGRSRREHELQRSGSGCPVSCFVQPREIAGLLPGRVDLEGKAVSRFIIRPSHVAGYCLLSTSAITWAATPLNHRSFKLGIASNGV